MQNTQTFTHNSVMTSSYVAHNCESVLWSNRMNHDYITWHAVRADSVIVQQIIKCWIWGGSGYSTIKLFTCESKSSVYNSLILNNHSSTLASLTNYSIFLWSDWRWVTNWTPQCTDSLWGTGVILPLCTFVEVETAASMALEVTHWLPCRP